MYKVYCMHHQFCCVRFWVITDGDVLIIRQCVRMGLIRFIVDTTSVCECMRMCVWESEFVSMFVSSKKWKRASLGFFFSYVSVKTKCMYKYKMALFERLVLIFLQDYKTFQEFGFVNTVHTTKNIFRHNVCWITWCFSM